MSNGFETCDQHTYLFATEGKDYPYCEIDRLKAELKEAQGTKMAQKYNVAKQAIASQKRRIQELKDDMELLERQLAEANHTVERYVSEMANTPGLLKELAEAKHELETTQLHLMEEETTRKIWEQDCKKAESQLAEAKASAQAWHDNCNIMEAELDKERNKHAETVGKLSEARAELDRYKAGVEVEGLFDVQYGLNLCSSETHKLDNSVRYGKVRVLIMKLEG